MQELSQIVMNLNSITPLGIVAALVYVIYLLVKQGKAQNKIATNHLHPLPEMSETLRRIESGQHEVIRLLNENSRDTAWIKARLSNGSNKN